jgi:hypothetical protein
VRIVHPGSGDAEVHQLRGEDLPAVAGSVFVLQVAGAGGADLPDGVLGQVVVIYCHSCEQALGSGHELEIQQELDRGRSARDPSVGPYLGPV